jgi:sugar phosphate isomerase/epimerase
MSLKQLDSGSTRRDFLVATLKLGGAGLLGSAAVPLAHINAPTPASIPHWQIGCYTRPWDKFDWRIAFDAMAEAGYKHVGLMTTNIKEWVMIRPNTPVEEARLMGDEAKARGLSVLSAYGDFSLKSSLEDGIAQLRSLIDNCAASSSPNLLLGGISDKTRYDLYYKAIAECCDYAAAKNVGLSIKPHGGQNATGPQCRKAIELVGHNNFRLWYDPGNIFYYSNGELDPVDDADTVNGLVVGMSVKDFRAPKEVLLTPGTGQVNFPKVLERLKNGGFTHGPLIVECLEAGDLAKITAEAKRAREFLEKLIAETIS